LFDIRTGESDGSVTTAGVPTFATKVEDDVIYVDLTGTKENAL
jgi:nitrite reductase/ring-hydroxylating ferredoxin subunit